MKALEVLYFRESARPKRRMITPDNYFVFSESNHLEASLNSLVYSIKMPLNGRERYRFKGQTHDIGPGSFIITNPGYPIEAEIKADYLVQGLCIGFSETFIQQLSGQILASPNAFLEKNAPQKGSLRFLEHPFKLDQDALSIFLQQVQKHWNNQTMASAYSAAQFYLDLGECLLQQQQQIYSKLQSLQQVKKATREEIYRRVDTMHQLIQDTYLDDLTVADLAQAACLSKYHAIRTYQKIKGISPYQHIIALRLQEAKRLLRKGLPLTEIAMATNFSDRRAFSRAFKKHFGHIPSQLPT